MHVHVFKARTLPAGAGDNGLATSVSCGRDEPTLGVEMEVAVIGRSTASRARGAELDSAIVGIHHAAGGIDLRPQQGRGSAATDTLARNERSLGHGPFV